MIENRRATKFHLGSFDLLKGVGAILFIISHTYTRYINTDSAILQMLLYFLLLPGVGTRAAFYLIGGLAFRETTPKKMLKKTFRSLMIPYLLVMAAYAVLFPLVRYPFMPSWREVFTYALRYVVAFLFGNIEYGKVIFGFEMYWCTPMYFFLSMFIAMNLLNLIVRNKNRYLQLLYVVICVVVGNILLTQKMYLFSLAYGLPAVGTYYIGYVLGHSGFFRKIQSNKSSYIICAPFLLLSAGLSNIEQPRFIINMVIWLSGILGALLIIFICDDITEKKWRGFGWLKYIGCYSYWIICIHSFETDAIPWFMYVQCFPNHHLFAFVLEMLIKATIITAGCSLLKLIMKYKYKWRILAHGK